MDLKGFSRSQLNLLQKQPVVTASALTSVRGEHDAEQTQITSRKKEKKKREKKPKDVVGISIRRSLIKTGYGRKGAFLSACILNSTVQFPCRLLRMQFFGQIFFLLQVRVPLNLRSSYRSHDLLQS